MLDKIIKSALILSVSSFVVACSQQPVIKSASNDRVVIMGKPDLYLRAFSIAKKECDKNERITQYVPDYSTELNILAFDCVTPEALLAAEAESSAQPEEEGIPDAVVDTPEEETPLDEVAEEEQVMPELSTAGFDTPETEDLAAPAEKAEESAAE